MNRSLVAPLLLASLLAACASDNGAVQSKPITKASDAVAKPSEMMPTTLVPSLQPKATPTPAPKEPAAPSEEPGLPPPAPTPAPTPEPAPPTPAPNVGNEDFALREAQKIAKNASLTCRNNDCNPSVGMISVVVKDPAGWGNGQCTATLIAPDVLVTNGHCVPLDIGRPGSSCQGRIWMNFAAEASRPEYDGQIGCSKILYRHKDTDLDGADYAYIKLERASNRPALRQSREGFEHGKLYHLHKVNPVRAKGGIAGQFEKVACKSMQDTAIFDQPLNRQSYTNLFVDCKVIPGNSGSPILGEDGMVRGVIWAFIKKELIHGLHSKNGSVIPAVNELADLNVGSNFACLKEPGDLEGRALPAACPGYAERLQAAKRDTEAKKVARLKPGARKLIAENGEGRDYVQAFDWSLKLSQSPTSGTIAIGIPECVRGSKAVAPLLDKKTNLFRPLFFVKAQYDRYVHASDHAVTWGSFSSAEESLEIRRSGADYAVEIMDINNGQTDFNGLMSACK